MKWNCNADAVKYRQCFFWINSLNAKMQISRDLSLNQMCADQWGHKAACFWRTIAQMVHGVNSLSSVLLNSLAPGRTGNNFQTMIFKLIIWNSILDTHCEIALR